jgi:tryptophan synthase alpha chain
VLENTLRKTLEQKEILLMTHIVIGYPSLDACFDLVETMIESGVDLMELQIPFSEPIADGPVILQANQRALGDGVRVEDCLRFADRAARTFDIPFLFMSYYNILFKYGVADFVSAMDGRGLQGAIVPDLPPEEGGDYLEAMEARGLSPIFTFAPTTPEGRMKTLASHGRGFVYCIARKGVTGAETAFSADLEAYLTRCRRATDLPLAVGFGVKEKGDIDFLRGKADIAVIGTRTIRIMQEGGIQAAGAFLKTLR